MLHNISISYIVIMTKVKGAKTMKAYNIHYQIKQDVNKHDYSMGVDAKDVKSAKNKIERRLNRKIKITEVVVIGYY